MQAITKDEGIGIRLAYGTIRQTIIVLRHHANPAPNEAHALPTWPQLGWLALFGTLQMGLPYLLMARGLRSVGPQEAGTLTLLEPILNPLWAYLVAPEKEKPTVHILVGGGCILAALAYRYWPFRRMKDEG